MFDNDFNKYFTYLSQKTSINVTIFLDGNYKYFKGGNNFQKAREHIRNVFNVVRNYYHTHFNVDLVPNFYIHELDLGSRIRYSYPGISDSCSSYPIAEEFFKIIKAKVGEIFYEKRPLFPVPTFRPQVLVFTSCVEKTVRGMADVHSSFWGLNLTSDGNEPISLLAIFSGPQVTDYDEAYTMLHEFGHTFGGDHEKDTDCLTTNYIMCPFYSSQSKALEKLSSEKFSEISFRNISNSFNAANFVRLYWHQNSRRLLGTSLKRSGRSAHSGTVKNSQRYPSRIVSLKEDVPARIQKDIFTYSNTYEFPHTSLLVFALQLLLALCILMRSKTKSVST